MADTPQWALDMRLPNTEVKRIGKGHYLYEVHCRYLRDEKRSKKTYQYIGRLVEGVGLVRKGERDTLLRAGARAGEADALRAEVARLSAELESLRGTGE